MTGAIQNRQVLVGGIVPRQPFEQVRLNSGRHLCQAPHPGQKPQLTLQVVHIGVDLSRRVLGALFLDRSKLALLSLKAEVD